MDGMHDQEQTHGLKTPGARDGKYRQQWATLRLAKMLCGFVFPPYIGNNDTDESTAAVITCTAVFSHMFAANTEFRTFLRVSNCREFVSAFSRFAIHLAAWQSIAFPEDA